MKSTENNLKQHLRVKKRFYLENVREKNAFWWPIKTPYIKHIYCRMKLIASMHHLWQLRKKMTFHQNLGPSHHKQRSHLFIEIMKKKIPVLNHSQLNLWCYSSKEPRSKHMNLGCNSAKDRSSTTNSGTKAAVLPGID